MTKRKVSDEQAGEEQVAQEKVLRDKVTDKVTDNVTPSATAAVPTIVETTADLLPIASDPALTEDLALALLKRPNLPAEVLAQLSKNAAALKSRKIKIALASHPRTPRHVSVPLARQLYTFDLVKVALSPAVPADVKVAVEGVLISRLKSVTLGERLTLARRASGRVAAALLVDVENANAKISKIGTGKIVAKAEARQTRLLQTVLDNPRLTENLVIGAVLNPSAGVTLVNLVARHPKWSRRKEVRVALLRTEYLSLARALEFSREIPAAMLREILAASSLPVRIQELILSDREAGKKAGK
jgi:hypothetical protein